MPKYIKCPRCELNYITQSMKYCTLCAKEIEEGLQEWQDEPIICPFCYKNTMQPDDLMCSQCKAKRNKSDS